jgi:hypothetical protein
MKFTASSKYLKRCRSGGIMDAMNYEEESMIIAELTRPGVPLQLIKDVNNWLDREILAKIYVGKI